MGQRAIVREIKTLSGYLTVKSDEAKLSRLHELIDQLELPLLDWEAHGNTHYASNGVVSISIYKLSNGWKWRIYSPRTIYKVGIVVNDPSVKKASALSLHKAKREAEQVADNYTPTYPGSYVT